MTTSGLDEIDFDYATSVAQKAQSLMAQHRVPPTPDNFAVWFKFALGTSAQLNMAMNVLIGNKRKFDPATNRDLYRAYVGGQAAERAIDLGVSEQLSTLMVSAQQYLATAIDDNRTQVRALGEVSAEASSGANPRRLIESLVRELSKATNRATALEANFAEASNELDKIRDSLEQAEERSKTDMLTGLANRRALDEFLRLAQISTMESGSALSVFLTDIDHFKSFNDNYGHQVGDQVIKLVAGVLREHVRDSDLAARYGGEELMAVLPGVDLDACREIAERIRSTIAERRIRRRATGEDISSVTISIGVAEFRFGESAESLIERCDQALYRAKREGRNRVMTEDDLQDVIAAE
jgi:diguanylate cyclase